MTTTLIQQFVKINVNNFEKVMRKLNNKMVNIDIEDSSFICEEFKFSSNSTYYILEDSNEIINYSIKKNDIKTMLIDECFEDDTAVQIVLIMNDDTEIIINCD